MKERIQASLIYDPADLEKYFEHGKAKDWIKQLEGSVEAVNRFGAEHSWTDDGGRVTEARGVCATARSAKGTFGAHLPPGMNLRLSGPGRAQPSQLLQR
jgi:hypothetical protein